MPMVLSLGKGVPRIEEMNVDFPAAASPTTMSFKRRQGSFVGTSTDF
jgi:hypothetical protein